MTANEHVHHMRPILSIFLFTYTIVSCVAQDTMTQTLQEFTELKVYDRITVTLIKGDKNTLIAHSADKSSLKVVENNGVLMIRIDQNGLFGNTMIALKLYYTEPLMAIDANENAKIASDGILKGTSLEIKAQEAGMVSLNVNVQTVAIKSASGSEISLSGTADMQNATLTTGGRLNNKNLKTKETVVTVLTGGIAEVYATDKLIAKVKAGGTVRVNGNPKILEKDATFGGTIQVNR